jgi:hypothetical protein
VFNAWQLLETATPIPCFHPGALNMVMLPEEGKKRKAIDY